MSLLLLFAFVPLHNSLLLWISNSTEKENVFIKNFSVVLRLNESDSSIDKRGDKTARPQHCTTEILAGRDKSVDFDTRGGKIAV